MDGIAYLISETFESNEHGQRVAEKTKREVFVTERSMTRSEFFSAGRQGLNPEIVLTTPKVNYAGEELVEYNGIVYSIYRTFQDGDEIELYAGRKAGAHE